MLDNIAAAYIRVSTKKQGEDGTSLETQRESVNEYAKDNGLILNENMIYEEVKPASTLKTKDAIFNINSKLEKRPQLQNLLASAHEGNFRHLIVFSRDRLTRDLNESLSLQFMLNKYKVQIHYSAPGENFNSKDQKINDFLESIFASINEYQANVIADRVKTGNLLCIKSGYWAGGLPPFGYSLDKFKNGRKENSKLKKNPTYAILIEKIFHFYNLGNGYSEVARLMNIYFPSICWTKGKIRTIIQNPTYTGYIYWDKRGGRRNPGKHDKYESSPFSDDLVIINESIWNRADTLRTCKSHLKNPKYYNTPFLLKDKLICEKCGEKLTPKNYGKNDKSVYRCPTKANSRSELVIEKQEIEKILIEKLETLIASQNIDEEWKLYTEKALEAKSSIKASITDLDERIKNSNLLKENIDKLLRQKLNKQLIALLKEERTILSKSNDYYNDFKVKLNRKLETGYFDNKDDFFKAICNLFKEYEEVNRIFIDLLIDNITVNKINNNLNLKILLNPPKNIL